MRIAKEERKATRGVTSAVNNLSFKNQCEALIGAVANPETHTHTHPRPSGSLLAAVLQLNWLQCSGGSSDFPPGITQSAKTAISGLPSPSHESGRDTSHCLTLAVTLSKEILRQIKATRRQSLGMAVSQINTQFTSAVICIQLRQKMFCTMLEPFCMTWIKVIHLMI